MNCLIKLYTCAFLLFCVIKDSVVLGDALSKCMTNVHKMFPESNSPKDNFLLAFKDYNQEHFNKLQETNDDAQGYFVDLINSVTDLVGDILDNPETFCQKFHSSKMDKMFHEEVLYILFGKKDKDPETDYGRILCITSELDAFKQFYLTQIYSELKRDHSNSSFHEHQDKLNKYEELDEDAKIRRKKSIMWVYLDQFNRQAELVAKNTKFRKVEAYCHSAIRKRDAYGDCLHDVYDEFPESNSSNDNFFNAFKDYNLEHFNNSDQEHFINLVTNVLKRPKSFYMLFWSDETDKTLCKEVLRILFGQNDIDPEEDIDRILNMRDLDAFKQFYLTQIYSKLMRDYSNGVPSQYQHTLSESQEFDEDSRKRRKISIMRLYLDQFYRSAEMVARYRIFNEVKEYCRSVTRQPDNNSVTCI